MLDGSPPQEHRGIRIDRERGILQRGEETVALRPKTWAVLMFLVARPGALVTKAELLDAVWPETAVSEGILGKSIGELREALGDEADAPRFVETVPRRGFRWLAAGTGGESPDRAVRRRPPPAPGPAASPAQERESAAASGSLVGRDRELAALQERLRQAETGSRQAVFLVGEAGAGKTTVVDSFVAAIGTGPASPLLALGQCIEALGPHEPFRPLLEALERLARGRQAASRVVEVLRSHGPNLLRQMPALGADRDGTGAGDAENPGRLLREIAATLEALSLERPVVLVLEDLHWADVATIDACNFLIRRRTPARILLLATLRAADEAVLGGRLATFRPELVARGLASQIEIDPFPAELVRTYLERRCPGLELDDDLASWIHHQTGGNALFVRILVDDLVGRGMLEKAAGDRWVLRASAQEVRDVVPDSLRILLERQIDSIDEKARSVAEAACVLHADFDAEAIADPAGMSVEEAEAVCAGLARSGRVLRRSPGGRFAFVHSLVQQVLHDRLAPTRRRRLHLAAAAALERGDSGDSDGAAVQLALHYAMAGEPAPALELLQRAAASVGKIPAPGAVVTIRERILALVEANPSLPGHRRERVRAMMEVAHARQLAFGSVDAETTAVCEKVLRLAVEPEDVRERFLAALGVFWGRYYAGRYAEALALARRLLEQARAAGLPLMIQTLEFSIGSVCYRMGDFDAARAGFAACLEHEPDPQRAFGWNFQSMSLSHLALIAVHEGHPEEARRRIASAEAIACRPGRPPDASVLPLLAFAFAMMRDDAPARALVDRCLALVDRTGSAAWIERARFLDGLLLSRSGDVERGLRRMRAALARQVRDQILLERSAYCFLLADEMTRRQLDGADEVVASGVEYMEASGERHCEAGLLRLRGVLRARGSTEGAREDLAGAIRVARSRGANWDALLAAVELARLLAGLGRQREAREALAPCVAGFGPDAEATVEHAAARELLASLA